jgi:hypothetical protein
MVAYNKHPCDSHTNALILSGKPFCSRVFNAGTPLPGEKMQKKIDRNAGFYDISDFVGRYLAQQPGKICKMNRSNSS